MNDLVVRTIELCAGVGMLGEGLRAGLGHLGIATRAVCYVEREAHAGAVLAARIEEGSLDASPIWSDMLTFDARAWRGAVDCIAAGFPCQDLSLAGRRAGLDGERSGLFFRVLDIADDSGAWCLFLENVSGIASATASVVDEAEGALDERAAARVLGELADRGWNAEWLTLSASDVGAAHGRERWFCFAWREVADRECEGWRPAQGANQTDQPGGEEQSSAWRGDGVRDALRRFERRGVVLLADTDRLADERRGEPGILAAPGRWLEGEGHQRERGGHAANDRIEALADAGCGSWQAGDRVAGIDGAAPAQDPGGYLCAADGGRALPIAEGIGRSQGWAQHAWQQGRLDVAGRSGAVAYANGTGFGDVGRAGSHRAWHEGPYVDQPRPVGVAYAGLTRLPHAQQQEPRGPGWGREGRAAAELRGAFAPGPADPRWPGILARWPELAPALEPGFRGLADGVAFDMGDSRAPRLKCVGNGVVVTCAAVACVELVRRARGGV